MLHLDANLICDGREFEKKRLDERQELIVDDRNDFTDSIHHLGNVIGGGGLVLKQVHEGRHDDRHDILNDALHTERKVVGREFSWRSRIAVGLEVRCRKHDKDIASGAIPVLHDGGPFHGGQEIANVSEETDRNHDDGPDNIGSAPCFSGW